MPWIGAGSPGPNSSPTFISSTAARASALAALGTGRHTRPLPALGELPSCGIFWSPVAGRRTYNKDLSTWPLRPVWVDVIICERMRVFFAIRAAGTSPRNVSAMGGDSQNNFQSAIPGSSSSTTAINPTLLRPPSSKKRWGCPRIFHPLKQGPQTRPKWSAFQHGKHQLKYLWMTFFVEVGKPFKLYMVDVVKASPGPVFTWSQQIKKLPRPLPNTYRASGLIRRWQRSETRFSTPCILESLEFSLFLSKHLAIFVMEQTCSLLLSCAEPWYIPNSMPVARRHTVAILGAWKAPDLGVFLANRRLSCTSASNDIKLACRVGIQLNSQASDQVLCSYANAWASVCRSSELTDRSGGRQLGSFGAHPGSCKTFDSLGALFDRTAGSTKHTRIEPIPLYQLGRLQKLCRHEILAAAVPFL